MVPSCCWTAFSLVGTRSWMSAWSSVWWFECCSGAFRHFNSCICLIFFGLVRRSVSFKDVSAGLLVFAYLTLPLFVLESDCFCSCFDVLLVAAKYEAAKACFCCLCGSPVSSGSPLGSFWAFAGKVFGVSNFPARVAFRLFCALAGFLRFQRMLEVTSWV